MLVRVQPPLPNFIPGSGNWYPTTLLMWRSKEYVSSSLTPGAKLSPFLMRASWHTFDERPRLKLRSIVTDLRDVQGVSDSEFDFGVHGRNKDNSDRSA